MENLIAAQMNYTTIRMVKKEVKLIIVHKMSAANEELGQGFRILPNRIGARWEEQMEN